MDEFFFRNRRERVGGEGEPGFCRTGRIPRMQARLLEQGDDRLVCGSAGICDIHFKKGLSEIVLRIEINQQDAPTKRALPCAEDLAGYRRLADAALQVHHRQHGAFALVGLPRLVHELLDAVWRCR